MVKQRFFRRNQPTRQEQVPTFQPDWVSLAPLLQDALRQRWLQSQPIHLRCAVLEATLLVLVEHLLHFEPDPKQIFNSLEATLQTLLLEFSTDSTLQDLRLPNPLPIQLLLRISGYQHPYATRKFHYALRTAEGAPLSHDFSPDQDGAEQEATVGLGIPDATTPSAVEPKRIDRPLNFEPASEWAEVPSAVPSLEPVEPILENFSPEVAASETIGLEPVPVEPVPAVPSEITALAETTSENPDPEWATSEATEIAPMAASLDLALDGAGAMLAPVTEGVEREISALEVTKLESIETASKNTAPTGIELEVESEVGLEVKSELLNLEQIETILEPSAPDIFTEAFPGTITEISALEVVEPEFIELPEDAIPGIPQLETVALEPEAELEREIADSGWLMPENPENHGLDAEQAILEQVSLEGAGEPQALAEPLADPAEMVAIPENLPSVVQGQPFVLTEPVEIIESTIEEHIEEHSDVEQHICTNWGASDPASDPASNESPEVSVVEPRESTPLEAAPGPISTPALNSASAELPPESPPDQLDQTLFDQSLQTPTETISNHLTSQAIEAPSSPDAPDHSLASPAPFRWTASQLGLAGAIGGFVLLSGWYVLSRPCVIGGCKPLRQARHLSQTALQTAQSTESALALVESYRQLNEASYLIGTIPAWSRYHHRGQALLDSYAEQAMVLSGVVKALEQANQAAQRSQNPPHPLSEWREIQWLWRDVIDQLGKISPDSSLYPLVQRKLAEYQANLTGINQRIGVEQQAQDRIDAARQAGQMAESRTSQAQSVEQWQETVNAWKVALEQLRLIPQGTMVYDEARQLLALYQPKLTESEKQRTREIMAADAYGQTLNAAEQARQLEAQNQWSQSRQYWQDALTYAQKIPGGTTYHSQVQPLIGTYSQKIQQARKNTHRSVALQTVQPSLDQICPASAQVCTYTLAPEAIRVQFTATYDQTVTLTIHQKQPVESSGTASAVVSRVNQVLRTLANIGETTQVPIELYNASGVRMGTYTPSLSGYVPQ